jgi:hypothetical protein
VYRIAVTDEEGTLVAEMRGNGFTLHKDRARDDPERA